MSEFKYIDESKIKTNPNWELETKLTKLQIERKECENKLREINEEIEDFLLKNNWS